MGDLDDSIVEDFLLESTENLDQLDHDLVALEADPLSRELLGRVFRTIHTIKGTCGFLGFSRLESVTHAGESLLSRLRDGTLKLDAAITSALLEMVDRVRQILAAIARDRTEGPGTHDDVIARLTALTGRAGASAASHGARPMIAASTPAPPAAPVSTPEASAAPAAPVPTAPPATTSPPNDTRGASRRLFEGLIESGRLRPDQIAMAEQQQQLGDPRRLGEILVEQGALKPQEVLEALARQGEALRQASDSNIRVDVHLLDRLMNLVGELVLARNQILQFVASQDARTLPATAQRLNLITSQLQDEVMRTRMQPIETLWHKLPRLTRDVSAACGKVVRLELEGGDTDLDKSVLEAIRDPLTHLVRNAIDHGIESRDVRLACGKPADGRLRVRAFHANGQVNIEIADDGGGMPIHRIQRRALERQLVTPERAATMTDQEWIELTMLPGFSTAERITNVSGRGVGMDVVKTNVERIGGSLDVTSRPNQGTTVRIRIPLTLAIVQALIVTQDGDRYAIPQMSLLELLRLDGSHGRSRIETVHGAPVVRLRGRLLPLVHLGRALGSDAAEPRPDETINVVVVQSEGRSFGLVVDRIHDTEEIVVKSLGDSHKRMPMYAGATILGDGQVCLILDVPGLAQHHGLSAVLEGLTTPDVAVAAPSTRTEMLLVFEAPGCGPMALSLPNVWRLEEFAPGSIERSGSRRLVQYRGMIMPLVPLGALFGQTTPVAGDVNRTVVIQQHGHVVGLVVDRVVDIVEEPLELDTAHARPGVRGSAVVCGRVTDVLDPADLVRLAASSGLLPEFTIEEAAA